MSTATLHSQRPVVEGEAHDLREELERLQSAIASMSRALGEANRARGLAEGRRQATENELANHRVMLDEANELRAALEHRLAEMEREFAVTRSELARQRTASAIRAKLLVDIAQARWWRRRPAIERASRVERLLQS